MPLSSQNFIASFLIMIISVPARLYQKQLPYSQISPPQQPTILPTKSPLAEADLVLGY
jgi:hypothetical protein